MDSLLHAWVDRWTLTTVAASQTLVRLYARLGDPTQRARALQGGQAATERMERLRLRPQLPDYLVLFQGGEDVEIEEKAWESMLQSLLGLSAYYAMAQNTLQGSETRGLRGPQNANHRSTIQAYLGFKTAFPEEVVQSSRKAAIETAAHEAAQGLREVLEADSPQVEEAVQSLKRILKAALESMFV